MHHRPQLLLLLLATIAVIALSLHLNRSNFDYQADNDVVVHAREQLPPRQIMPMPGIEKEKSSVDTAVRQATNSVPEYPSVTQTVVSERDPFACAMEHFTRTVNTTASRPLNINEAVSPSPAAANPSERILAYPDISLDTERLLELWGSSLFARTVFP